MSSSTATIASQNSTMNNNDRKRPISSSIRPSPSPPSAKRHGLSAHSRQTTNKIKHQTERPSRSKQQYRHIDNKSSSSESSRSSSNSINQDYSSSTIDRQKSNEILSTKKSHLNSNQKSDTIYTKKNTLIVKPTPTIDQRNHYDTDEEFEQTKQIFTKSPHVVGPSSVTTPDSSKQSMTKDNVIIGNSNTSTKLVKLVVPQSLTSSSSIKMLSSGGGLASALRVPTKIQLTNPLFVSSPKTDQNSSLISSTSNQSITEESLSSDNLLDTIEKQQTTVDYQSSTALPLTPPPPVLDTTNSNVRTTDNQPEKIEKILSTNSKIIEETEGNPNEQIKSKRQSSLLSDWSVPPTSELSPTSLTSSSSSPDLTQNHLPLDDSLVELDPSIHFKETTKRRHRSLSSFPISSSRTTEKLHKSKKSKSLTRLSNSSDRKLMLLQQQRASTSSPILKLSSSQRINKRRRDNENLILNHKSKTKYLKIELDNHLIIQNLLNEIIERIISTNDERDNTLKSLLFKPVPQKTTLNVIPNRQTKSSNNKKLYSSSPSIDSTGSNESPSMVMTRKELDELAYLLHANVQRGDYERMNNPANVEERMREMWTEMSNQKKNSYYKRVIQIYKRPNRDVVITSSSPINETNDNTVVAMNSFPVEFKRQTSTPLSFHSLPSSTTDESPSKSIIFTDVVNELIRGAKGLDKLSCSPVIFAKTIDDFVQSSLEKQTQILLDLEQHVEKKCSTQLTRASIFWKQKLTYFATKHQIHSSNETMNELTLIIKYFYLYVLSLNCQKQELEFESTVTNLIQGNFTLIDSTYSSSILTSIIDDLILTSSLANDYLASQILIINQLEYSLPWIRNHDLENDLFNMNEIPNPFLDFNDLEDYLNRCEHMTTSIPASHSSMYYPSYPYYYSSSPADVNNYYYNNYPNSQYPYTGQPTSYYHHPSITYSNNEQLKYYYNQQQTNYHPYSTQSNSTNDIPVVGNNPSSHRTYRSVQRTYSNSQQPSTPSVFDPTTAVVSPQSTSPSAIIDT